MKRLSSASASLALAAVLAACSGASAALRPPGRRRTGRPAGGDGSSIVAKDLKFTTRLVTAPRGRGLRPIVLDNQEARPAQHRHQGRGGQRVFKGEIVTSTKITEQRPGARRRHVRLPLRSPSGHEGHDHRGVALRPRVLAASDPGPAARSGVTSSCEPGEYPRSLNPTGDRDARIIDLAKRYGPVVALDGATLHRPPGPDRRLPGAQRRRARPRRCAASSAWPGRTAARSAGRASRSIARRACASATCPSSAASTRGCGSASSSATSPSSTACPAATPTRPLRAGWSGWASATARSRSSRSCRTATSSASSSRPRWRTTRSCSSSTSRSPASTRSASRR